MKNGLLSALLLGTLLHVQARADDVYLTNGEVFEGVIAEVGESRVKIRLPIGRMSLPKSQVLRVEESKTPLEEYQRRRSELQQRVSPSPAEWLDLALWAKVNGLSKEYREVTLMIAELVPQLDGLGPVMRSLGYTLDDSESRWVSTSDFKRRQGLVHYEGQWVTREERLDRLRQRQEERALLDQERARADTRRREAPNEGATTKALETLAEAQVELVRGVLAAVAPGSYTLPAFIGTGSLFHGGFRSVPTRLPGLRHPASGGSSGPQTNPWELLINRQPGSLIPVNHPHHRPRF